MESDSVVLTLEIVVVQVGDDQHLDQELRFLL